MNVATKKEFLESLREADHKHDRLVIANKVLFALVVGLFLAMAMAPVFAEPMAQGSNAQGTITIFTEECQLKNFIDLEKRATLERNGKVMEGCISVLEGMNMFVFYYQPAKQILLIDGRFFHRVTGV